MKNTTETLRLQAKISGFEESDEFEHFITISLNNFNLNSLCQILQKMGFLLMRWAIIFILKYLEMRACINLEKSGFQWSAAGFKPVNIFTIFGNISYPRQRVELVDIDGNRRYHILLKSFLPKAQPNKGIVTRSVKELAANLALDMTYRNSEKWLLDITHSDISPLSDTTIWRQIQELGQKAEEMNSSLAAQFPIHQVSAETLYLLVDGIHVLSQEPERRSIEGKIGLFLMRKNKKTQKLASTVCFHSVDNFVPLLETELKRFKLKNFKEITLISDGAKWIPMLRFKIPKLKNAQWILDWFHLIDNLQETLKTLFMPNKYPEFQKDYNLFLQICSNYLREGNWQSAAFIIERLAKLPQIQETEEREIARATFLKYLSNNQEGIVNYSERYNNGKLTSSAIVEKFCDDLIAIRFKKRRAQKWKRNGAQNLAFLRSKTINGQINVFYQHVFSNYALAGSV